MDIRVAGGGGGGFLNNGVQVGGLGGVAAGSLQVVPGDHFTVDVGCDGNSSSPGALTFTATAQPTAGVPGTPTGTVGFSVENGAPLIGVDGKPLTQPVALVNGVAQTPIVDQSKLTFGTHTVELFVVNFNVGGAPPPGSGNGGPQTCAALSTALDRAETAMIGLIDPVVGRVGIETSPVVGRLSDALLRIVQEQHRLCG